MSYDDTMITAAIVNGAKHNTRIQRQTFINSSGLQVQLAVQRRAHRVSDGVVALVIQRPAAAIYKQTNQQTYTEWIQRQLIDHNSSPVYSISTNNVLLYVPSPINLFSDGDNRINIHTIVRIRVIVASIDNVVRIVLRSARYRSLMVFS